MWPKGHSQLLWKVCSPEGAAVALVRQLLLSAFASNKLYLCCETSGVAAATGS